MPRKTRIDAPGALHHVIARGIERKSIFRDNKDQNDSLERLRDITAGTETDKMLCIVFDAKSPLKS